jgi:thymidylate kinase
MYIAIEGIKGTGKSTIIRELSGKNSDLAVFPITGRMSKFHPLELQHAFNPGLKTDDTFLEHLFKERAYWNQDKVIGASPLILGDRSVVTSYVTRWNKWYDPNYTIRKVNREYWGIMKPDVIVWIDSPVNLVSSNIKSRQQKDLGKQDECLDRLLTARHIYEELFSQKLLLKKCFRSQIVKVDGRCHTSELLDEVLGIIEYYRKTSV